MAKTEPNIKWWTRQRFQYIEVMAYYTGVITRSDLAETFGLSNPAATKDLKLYSDMAPDNLIYKHAVFGFVPSDSFAPIFADLSPATILPIIAGNLTVIGSPREGTDVYGICAETLPLPTRLPDMALLAQLVRGIKNHRKVRVTYQSLSDRDSDEPRTIEPHALLNNGLRWHLRAYNEDTFDFRDFVLSRFTSAEMLETDAESNQMYDDDWVEYVTLQLTPHPNLDARKRNNLMLDYAAVGDVIELTVRRALIGYVLQRLSVDTTMDHSLNPNAYQLVVVNRDEIEPFASWAFL